MRCYEGFEGAAAEEEEEAEAVGGVLAAEEASAGIGEAGGECSVVVVPHSSPSSAGLVFVFALELAAFAAFAAFRYLA